MGKSEGNAIYLIDDEKVLTKKVKRAVTDGGPAEPNSPMAEPVANLFTLLQIASTEETYNHFLAAYNDCSIRYGDLKGQLAEDLVALTAPIRERILELQNDQEYLNKVAREGAERARESARQTLEEVRRIIGFRPTIR